MVCTIQNSILDAEAMIRGHKNVFLTEIYMEKNREKFFPIFATSSFHPLWDVPYAAHQKGKANISINDVVVHSFKSLCHQKCLQCV